MSSVDIARLVAAAKVDLMSEPPTITTDPGHNVSEDVMVRKLAFHLTNAVVVGKQDSQREIEDLTSQLDSTTNDLQASEEAVRSLEGQLLAARNAMGHARDTLDRGLRFSAP